MNIEHYISNETNPLKRKSTYHKHYPISNFDFFDGMLIFVAY